MDELRTGINLRAYQIKLALALPLIPRFGIVAAGALLSFYYIASVGAMVIRGLKEIQKNENRSHH